MYRVHPTGLLLVLATTGYLAPRASASGVWFDGLGPLSPAASEHAPAFPVVTPAPSIAQIAQPQFGSFHHAPSAPHAGSSISFTSPFLGTPVFGAVQPPRPKLVSPLVPASTQLTPGHLHRVVPLTPISTSHLRPVVGLHATATSHLPVPPPPALHAPFHGLQHVQVQTPHSFLQFAFPVRHALLPPSPAATFGAPFFGR